MEPPHLPIYQTIHDTYKKASLTSSLPFYGNLRKLYPNLQLCAIIYRKIKRKCELMKNKVFPAKALITSLIGVAFMAFGIYRGEMATVLAKAIRICLECIGIG